MKHRAVIFAIVATLSVGQGPHVDAADLDPEQYPYSSDPPPPPPIQFNLQPSTLLEFAPKAVVQPPVPMQQNNANVSAPSANPKLPPAPQTAPSAAATAQGAFEFQLLVTLSRGAPTDAWQGLAQTYSLAFQEEFTVAVLNERIGLLDVVDGRAIDALARIMTLDGRVAAAQPNYRYELSQQNLPAGAVPQYGIKKMRVPATREMATGQGVVVAVLDTPIDASHPALAGKLVGSFDPRGPIAAADRHGTAMAAIIATSGGLESVAPGASILGAHVFTPSTDGAAGPFSTSELIVKGIDWSVRQGAHILNMSFAGPDDPLVKRVIGAVLARGIVVVASAGNGGPGAPPSFPGAYSGVIAVTATDARDRLFRGATRGAYIVVAAPGVDILSAVPGSAYGLLSGTSPAAAHVSGLAALIVERSPDATPAEIGAILSRTAVDLGVAGPDKEFGAGRVDALAALRSLN